MKRPGIFVYGVLCYFAFFGTILYMVGFLANAWVPKSIDSGTGEATPTAIFLNLFLIALFAIQHTIMARPAFKERFTRAIPEAAERSTFVLASSAVLAITMAAWRPMTGVLWDVDFAPVRIATWTVYAIGWAMVFGSSFLIDHFDLFGLKQSWHGAREETYERKPFVMPFLYKVVRHPLMLGFVLALWAAPTMTTGRLLFASGFTIYILMGIRFEERDLIRHHGEDYAQYRQSTSMLIPFPKRGGE